MKFDEVAASAEAFVTGIPLIDTGGRLKVQKLALKEDAGRFGTIFREKIEVFGGVYWFFRPAPDGTVFYIGKAERHIWNRLFQHTGTAEWRGEGPPPLYGTPEYSGASWGFPGSKKWNSGSASEETLKLVRAGDFHVGWIAIEPWSVVPLIEVYLQVLCMAIDHDQPHQGLPELCSKIG